MCRSFIVCVALLPDVSLTRFEGLCHCSYTLLINEPCSFQKLFDTPFRISRFEPWLSS